MRFKEITPQEADIINEHFGEQENGNFLVTEPSLNANINNVPYSLINWVVKPWIETAQLDFKN